MTVRNSSSDGATWTQVTSVANEWSIRYGQAGVVFNELLWVMVDGDDTQQTLQHALLP